MYQAMDEAIRSHVLHDIGPFVGEGFSTNETATEDWLARFASGAPWAQLRGIS